MLIFKEEDFFPTKYEGYYVSKSGKILSTRRKPIKIIKPRVDKDGYLEYVFTIKGKKHYVRGHRIIAYTFISNPENKPQINHKDGNKANNVVENLEWCTSSENNLHRCRTLGHRPVNEVLYNIYEGDTLFKTCNKEELRKLTSYDYIKDIDNNNIKYNYMYFEKTENQIVTYWNGKIYKTFSSVKETAKYFWRAPNTISARINQEQTKVQLFAKQYTIIKQ